MDIQPLVSKGNRLGLSESLCQPNRLTLRQESNHRLSNSIYPITNHTPLTTSKFLLSRRQNNKFLNSDSLVNLDYWNDIDGNMDLFLEPNYYQHEDISTNNFDVSSVRNQNSVNNNELVEKLSSNNLDYLDTTLSNKANKKPKSQRQTKSKPTSDSKPQAKKTTKSCKTSNKGKHEVLPLQQASNQTFNPTTPNIETTASVLGQRSPESSEIEPLQQASKPNNSGNTPNLETTLPVPEQTVPLATSEIEPLQQASKPNNSGNTPNLETTLPVPEQT
ncbi:MAG: hypothetical protein V7L25_15070, partial [Nostoc sp.]|uniref:hypothetical protein n=1 Tax=Nostoc sp. TaxID=1180 RepID=UPI002FF2FAEE